MIVNIIWFNTLPWRGRLGGAHYYYDIYAMAKNSYSTHTAIWDPFRVNRTVLVTHGILVQANIMGQIGVFNFNTLLLQLTASLTLIAVASVLVNYVATCFLKYRAYY